jgi:hypothetical protein
MTTSLVTISDRFMMLQSDFRLTQIYTSGSTTFNTYVEAWLIFAADEFSEFCDQDLEYSTTTQLFTSTLTQENINILAQFMVKYWLQKEIQDVLQMNNFITDHDYKQHSNAQNLKAKQDYYIMKNEELSQILTSYSYRHNDWDNWQNQLFSE